MKTSTAVAALSALAQDTRLAVYRLLVQQGPSGLAAGEIAGQLGIAPATLSFHLKELAHAGLVSSRQEGRFVYYAANFEAMNALVAFLTENCCAADCGPSCAPVVACKPVAVARNARVATRTKRSKACGAFPNTSLAAPRPTATAAGRHLRSAPWTARSTSCSCAPATRPARSSPRC